MACGRPPFTGVEFPEGEWQGAFASQPWAYDPYNWYWANAAMAKPYDYGYDPYAQYDSGLGYEQFYAESSEYPDQSDYWGPYADPALGQEYDPGES